MAQLVWDKTGEKFYETGLDRGVLYIPSSPGDYDDGVAWNGLTSVNEKFPDDQVNEFYYDGVQCRQEYLYGDFSATLSAYTYPDEFSMFDGTSEWTDGFYVDNQTPNVFGLSYRTSIGTDIDGAGTYYKLHLLYNLTAIPSDSSYSTDTNNVTAVEFSWDLTSVPEKAPQYRPTAHVIIDSRYINKNLLETLELILYGHNTFKEAEIIDGGTPYSSNEGFLDGGQSYDPGPGFIDCNEKFIVTQKRPRLPSLFDLIKYIINFDPKFIVPDELLGLATLLSEDVGDLTRASVTGVYTSLPETRLVSSWFPGTFLLKEG